MSKPEQYFLERGRLLWQFGFNEQGLGLTQKALDLNPEYAEAWFVIGQIHASLGQRNEAYESLGKAADLAMAQENFSLYTVARVNLGQLMQAPPDFQSPVGTAESTVTP
jgi:tetratricopeptide (TPR) repeat protein